MSSLLDYFFLFGTDMVIGLHASICFSQQFQRLASYCGDLGDLLVDRLCTISPLDIFLVWIFQQVIQQGQNHSLNFFHLLSV